MPFLHVHKRRVPTQNVYRSVTAILTSKSCLAFAFLPALKDGVSSEVTDEEPRHHRSASINPNAQGPPPAQDLAMLPRCLRPGIGHHPFPCHACWSYARLPARDFIALGAPRSRQSRSEKSQKSKPKTNHRARPKSNMWRKSNTPRLGICVE